jgi:protein-disulfide isomerase
MSRSSAPFTPPFTLTVPVNQTDHVLGPAAARITLVEYGDFECPSCFQAYPAIGILLKHFEGRMRFVYRHFPLREVHPHAELAAEAAEAAGAQGKFWEMYALLFEHQSHLKAKSLREYAEKLELDMARYDFEMRDHVYLQRVQEHIAGGTNSGIRATPAFYVNGAMHDASFGVARLQEAIEEVLRG